MACELPAEQGVPLSRWSAAELAVEAVKRGIVAQIAAVTIWRWLSEDAIRPWNYRSWIFPRDPNFAQKAGRILDLYEGRWEGELLGPGDFVVCCDEKPSIQARARKHPSQPAKPGGDGQLVEHEYERKGALCYLAAWDVRRARLFDRCAPKDGITPFDELIEQFMTEEPYSNAQRVFVVVDNGSAHRGQRSIDRLQGAWPNLRLVHTPVHASWVNQAEIYFSVAQRKVLHSQPLPRPRHARADTARVRAPLRTDRPAIRVEVHPQGPQPAPRTPRPTKTPTPDRRVTHRSVNVLGTTTTKPPALAPIAVGPRGTRRRSRGRPVAVAPRWTKSSTLSVPWVPQVAESRHGCPSAAERRASSCPEVSRPSRRLAVRRARRPQA